MYASTAFFVGAESSPNVLRQRQGKSAISEEEKQEEEVKEDSLSSFRSFSRFMVTNVYAFVFLTYSLWTLLGILFYKYYDNFTTATAYYYAMEAGLSIGFCNPSEKDDWSRLFTIFYVLLGSCFVSGAIGIIAASILSSNPSLVKVRHEFGAFGMEDESGKMTVGSFFRFFWYHLKLLVGWYTNRSFFVSALCFVVWIAWGTAYVMVSEKYSFITGLYWAITTISTGGLQSPVCLDNTTGATCDIGALRGGIMGFYMMIGVPIYAVFIAQVARYTVIAALRAREDRLLNHPIADADFLFAANILSPEGSETLVMGEFILLELMRLGLTNARQIENIKAKFRRIDKEKRGELDIDALRKIGVVVPRKLHSVEVSRARVRNRSMDLIGAIRYSATNLTDSILAATANLQLGSPTRGRSQTGDIEAADRNADRDHSKLTATSRRSGLGNNHDRSPERKANDRDVPLPTGRDNPKQQQKRPTTKASFRKSGGRRNQYLNPHENNQYNAEDLIPEDGYDGYTLASQSQLQAQNDARYNHEHQDHDEDGNTFADFYYNKEEAPVSPVLTRSSPDAVEGKTSMQASPQQTQSKQPTDAIIKAEYEDGEYSDEDEIIHVSYQHFHPHQPHIVYNQGSDNLPHQSRQQPRQQLFQPFSQSSQQQQHRSTEVKQTQQPQQVSTVQNESMDI